MTTPQISLLKRTPRSREARLAALIRLSRPKPAPTPKAPA